MSSSAVRQPHRKLVTPKNKYAQLQHRPGQPSHCDIPYHFYAHSMEQVHAQAPPTCDNPNPAIRLLRAYSAGAKDHFYTADVAEHDNFVNKLGYSDEGVTGYIFSYPDSHSVPLYRLYSSTATDHFYTTSAVERDNARRFEGYDYEGITGYGYPDAAYGGFPLYRLYSSGATDHSYTMSAAERDNAINNLGYAQEGIVGYIFPS
jgi:hypothetical protein